MDPRRPGAWGHPCCYRKFSTLSLLSKCFGNDTRNSVLVAIECRAEPELCAWLCSLGELLCFPLPVSHLGNGDAMASSSRGCEEG